MRKTIFVLVAMGLMAGVALAVTTALAPTNQRAIPLVSSAATALSKAPTIAAEAAGAAVDTTHVTLGALASGTVNDAYNGLMLHADGTGSCADNDDYEGTITDYVASTKVAVITPASTDAIDPNCTVTVGPGIPQNVSMFRIGGASGTIYYSQFAGGTAGTIRKTLTGGAHVTFEITPKTPLPYVEILPASATDTVDVEWQ